MSSLILAFLLGLTVGLCIINGHLSRKNAIFLLVGVCLFLGVASAIAVYVHSWPWVQTAYCPLMYFVGLCLSGGVHFTTEYWELVDLYGDVSKVPRSKRSLKLRGDAFFRAAVFLLVVLMFLALFGV